MSLDALELNDFNTERCCVFIQPLGTGQFTEEEGGLQTTDYTLTWTRFLQGRSAHQEDDLTPCPLAFSCSLQQVSLSFPPNALLSQQSAALLLNSP